MAHSSWKSEAREGIALPGEPLPWPHLRKSQENELPQGSHGWETGRGPSSSTWAIVPHPSIRLSAKLSHPAVAHSSSPQTSHAPAAICISETLVLLTDVPQVETDNCDKLNSPMQFIQNFQLSRHYKLGFFWYCKFLRVSVSKKCIFLKTR